MPTPTDRLIDACRRWADEVDEPAYSLAYWALLFLGGAYEGVGKNPDLAKMSPRERGSRPMIEHEGHPTLEHLRDRINALVRMGVFEPFLIAAIAHGIASELDELSDAPAIFAQRRRLVADLERMVADPDRRSAFIAGVREQREPTEVGEPGEYGDHDVEEFVRKNTEMLQPLTSAEIAEREWCARQWKLIAADLLDFRALIGEGLRNAG